MQTASIYTHVSSAEQVQGLKNLCNKMCHKMQTKRIKSLEKQTKNVIKNN